MDSQDLQAYCVLASCGRKAPRVCPQGTHCLTGTVSSLEMAGELIVQLSTWPLGCCDGGGHHETPGKGRDCDNVQLPP